MRLKPILTWDANEKKVRLIRIIWSGDYKCFSLALVPKIFHYKDFGIGDKRLVLFGVSFHYMRSYGGRFA